MRMEHLYKPLMLIAILRNGGAATRDDIAAEFLIRDVFQRDNYRRRVVDQMPGKRLVRDGALQRNGNVYSLAQAVQGLPRSQQVELLAACERRIEDFLTPCGPLSWSEYGFLSNRHPNARYSERLALVAVHAAHRVMKAV